MLQLNAANDMTVIRSEALIQLTLLSVNYQASDYLRWTDWTEEVADGGYIYEPRTFKFGAFRTASDGKTATSTLTVANADREIQFFMQQYKLLGKKVRIALVFFDTDMVKHGEIVRNFTIEEADMAGEAAVFTLSIGFNMLTKAVPARKLLNFCQHQFRDGGCRYAGADTDCSKMFDDCLKKGNSRYFNGFPGMPKQYGYY